MFFKLTKIITTVILVVCILEQPTITFAKQNSRADYQKLVDQLNIYDHAYYVDGKQLVSNEIFDTLMKELIAIEKEHPEWIREDSPNQHVGNDIAENAKTFLHKAPMLSIQNTKDLKDLIAFDQKNQRFFAAAVDYYLEEKIDGVAISLEYQEGKLIRALTRGDGTKGKDVSAIALALSSIPKQLPDDFPQTLEIRGEIYILKATFEQINKERSLSRKEPFANARNLAAASLNLKDPKEASQRNLQMTAYAIGFSSEPIALTQEELLQKLQNYGFTVPIWRKHCPTINDAVSSIQGQLNNIEILPYEIDGFVVKVNDLAKQKALGTTSKDVLGMIAYKFYNATAKTNVRNIIWQVGRTGRITPVAILDPVWIDGSMISRVSLSSQKTITTLHLCIGDQVQIEKSGRVIPKIVKVLKHAPSSEKNAFSQNISQCPACRLAFSIKMKGNLICENKNCHGRIKKQIEYFAGKDRMNINELTPQLIDGLVDKKIIKRISDLYHLNAEILLRSGLVSETQAHELLRSIEASKTRPLEKILSSIGVDLLGPQKAKIIAGHFHSLKDLSTASLTDLQMIPKIGKKISINIKNYFEDDNNQMLLNIFTD